METPKSTYRTFAGPGAKRRDAHPLPPLAVGRHHRSRAGRGVGGGDLSRAERSGARGATGLGAQERKREALEPEHRDRALVSLPRSPPRDAHVSSPRSAVALRSSFAPGCVAAWISWSLRIDTRV